jgi:hypothetical protein
MAEDPWRSRSNTAKVYAPQASDGFHNVQIRQVCLQE